MDAARCLSRLQKLCSKAEYCRADIRRKALKDLEGDEEAADKVVLGNVSVFDKYLCDIYGREFAAYFAGEKEKDAAIRVFYTEVSDLISEEE